ncbi:glycosyltransferase [Paenibacillus spongiae]|uniref:Glycosyltransferase family 2 protein n=1 Tax=Paenibacillus spongiae TaxID=2909671 RepID=A0ABY5S4X0_9BACL|nr:glycosyltransferase family A protein [Paenibacillus spongiae]UVI28640.1 glycosyltransferase family 2 protein [Paenibacillus spongiae]
MISVICCTIRDNMMENVFRNYDTQKMKKKELIIILNEDKMDRAKWIRRSSRSKNVSVYRLSKKTTLGECLNFAIHKAKYDIVAKIDDDDYYAPRYLSQQVKALKNKKADVVCKRTVYMYFEQEKKLAIHLDGDGENKFLYQAEGAKGSTFVFRKKIRRKIKFSPLNMDEDMIFLRECTKHHYKIYATDKKNYVCFRRSERLHTWSVPNQSLLEESKIIRRTKHYKRYVQ